ncbi:MAG TPA: hypothetical protein VGB59_08600 [Allosphingosinicella sp.]
MNRIASWNGTLSYDAKGNITQIGSASYGYSSENLLTSAPNYTLNYDPLTNERANTPSLHIHQIDRSGRPS